MLAQSAGPTELELCASLETAELKLACFEALTARYAQTPEPAAAPEPAAPVAVPDPAPSPPVADEQTVRPSTPIKDKHAGDEVITATVVKVTRNRALRRLTFEMENGEIWRQMESDRLHYPKDGPFEVEIRQGFMGDYQMRIGGDGRMTRIVRLR